MTRIAARRTVPRRRRRGLLLAAPASLLLLLPVAPAPAPSPALALTAPPPVRQTTFTGAITSGTRKYAHLRGAARLVLRGSTTTAGLAFKLTFSGPSCASQRIHSPSGCVVLTGTVTGKATRSPTNPDTGRQFALAGSGRVAPLGQVRLGGSTRGTGFIAHGQFPLTVTLSNAGGSVGVTAQSPPVPGFSAPF